MKAKKSYGQHFLKSEAISENIANSLILNGQYNKILEVGPGRGMLTKYLLQRPEELFAVEADQDMVHYLQKHYPALKDNLISGNFLKIPLDQLFVKSSFALIGNFPYNISSQILFKMLDYREQIPEMVGMFQKEVAERVIAPHGSKTYGVISVLIQAFYNGSYLFTVDKSEFLPPPKVQSAVIRMVRNQKRELDCDEKLFKKIVKQAFSQRRKMLRNTMKVFVKGMPLLEDPFFNQRPEQISVEGFIELTQRVEKEMGKM